MSRLLFGGGIADWAFGADGDNNATLAGGAQITFYNAESGGDRYTDLLTPDGSPITAVTASSGADGRSLGQIPPFLGPDGVFMLWASANGGPRAAMTAVNLGEFLGPIKERLDAHVSSTNRNPHETRIGDIVGVDMTGAADGKILGVTASGLVVPLTVPGLSGTVQLTGAQTVTGPKTFSDAASPGTTRVRIDVPAAQTVDAMAAYAAGVLGFSLDADAQARARATAAGNVAFVAQGAAGQTADVMQVLNSSGGVLLAVGPSGAVRAPNVTRTLVFSKAGTPTIGGAAGFRWYNDTGVSLTVKSVRASLGTAASSNPTRVDVNRDGASLFGTTAAQPSIAAGSNTSGVVTGMTTTAIPAGSYLTVDVDTVGTGAADLTVQVEVQ